MRLFSEAKALAGNVWTTVPPWCNCYFSDAAYYLETIPRRALSGLTNRKSCYGYDR